MKPLANPLATVAQLETSSSQLDGVPRWLEDSVRFAGTQLTQAAGILLRLPQELIAQAIVIFTRFYVGPEGGSMAELGVLVSPRAPWTCLIGKCTTEWLTHMLYSAFLPLRYT